MPPMASAQVKRKWSELDDSCERQLLMDLCAAKLRYVNPPRPPKRRTEVPLLRSVLIVNAMKHLSSEMKIEKMVDSSTEDLSVDPGHFEGLPPLSELLTDIMLDPQPLTPSGDNCYQQQSVSSSFNWSSTSSPHYSPITPVQPTLPSYLDTDSLMETSEDEKTVHNLLPCTSVLSTDVSHAARSWEPHADILDSFLSDSSVSHSPSDSLSFSSDFTFQPPKNPLPSFTSLFDSTHSHGNYSEQSQMPSSNYSSVSTASSLLPSTSNMMNFPFMNLISSEDTLSSANFSESDLEILAKTFSAKLPTLSFEELVHVLPQSTFSQQIPQPSPTPFHVPSALQNSSPGMDSNPAANNQCASYCRKDQPPPNVDEGSMVRVLVNL